MKSSTVSIFVLAFISVSAFDEEKKNETVVTYPDADAVDAEEDVENKGIADLKQKIADIVGEAFYKITTAKEKDLKSIEQSDSESDGNISTHVDDIKQSDEFVVNEDKINVDNLNDDSEDTSSGLSMAYIYFVVLVDCWCCWWWGSSSLSEGPRRGGPGRWYFQQYDQRI
jgi:hypothetical protein